MSSKMTIIEGNSNDKDNVRAYMVKGEPGTDGVSPTITPSRSGEQTTLTIVDAEGTKQAVLNDGFSPTVETSKTDGVTTVEITDINGTRTTEIVDGIDLTGGVPTAGVIGFDGEAADIPDGYEVIGNIDEKLVHVGATAPTDGERVWFSKSKNLLKIVANTQTTNGITFTQNSDGSISAVGTATADAKFQSTSVQKIKPNTNYFLSGCPAGGSLSTHRLILRLRSDETTGVATLSDLGDGLNVSASQTSNVNYILGEIWVYSGQTVNFTFYPMLKEGSTATAYEPYIENPSINVDEEELHFDNYSTNEQVIGKWIDGKPLYRKVLDIGAMPNNAQGGTQHGISNINIIVNARIMMTNGSNFIPAPSGYPGNTSLDSYVYADKNYIYIRTGTDRSTYNGYGILEYTKTTD